MSRPRASAAPPNDEEMPYSDDETDDELDDELDEGSESEADEPQEADRPAEEEAAAARPPEIGWKVKANDREYHQLPEFKKKVFLCIKKSRYSL
ncbi:phospholipid-transporting ATPase IC-like isoform X2 [Gambusia affinis]|uniref:phospholipid-transporting ATPase IC-like isoform X2 n=1 Tax=Gambusia affinis TaxID=33528 RepID=UPI001CDC16DC|nr:phospholipid-transporting ATPase IC-like isoform X2 [Gambusia affinis]